MIQRAGPADPRLDAMTRAIIGAVRPRRVILFGSRARGDARPDSDYDFVIEISCNSREEESALSSRAAEAIRALDHDTPGGFDILVRAVGTIEARCNDPGFLDWDIAREGVVLFAATGVSSDLRSLATSATRVREHRQFPSVEMWLKKADSDRRTIGALLSLRDSIPWDAVGFHAQQLAEKYLKALLVSHGVRPPRTHALNEFVTECGRHAIQLGELSDECMALEKFGVDARYPDDGRDVGEGEGRAAVEAAERIVAVVSGLLT